MNHMQQKSLKIIAAIEKFALVFMLFMGFGLHCAIGHWVQPFKNHTELSGMQSYSILENNAGGNSVAIQADGKIVVGGTNGENFTVVRYLTDGSLDDSFNSAGTQPGVVITAIGASTTSAINAVAIQSDGKILAAGTDGSHFVLVRYLANGSLDTSFNTLGTQPGIVTTPIGISLTSAANSIAIQANDSILIAGTDGSNFVLARYSPEGSLDISFNSAGTQPGIVQTAINGSVSSAVNSLALQVDGRILAGGTDESHFVLARYFDNGLLDTTFNGASTQPGVSVTTIGTSVTSAINALAIQVDGNIVAFGTDGLNFVVARYRITGILDAAFGIGVQPGVVVTPINHRAFANAGVIQANGKIMAAGVTIDENNQESFALVRYLTTGLLDNTFGGNGIVITSIPQSQLFSANDVTIQSDGSIVAIGRYSLTLTNAEFALTRYMTMGMLDSGFGNDGIVTTPIDVLEIATSSDNYLNNRANAVDPSLNGVTIMTPQIKARTPIILRGTAQNQSIITVIIDGVTTDNTTITPPNMSGDETNTTGTWMVSIGELSAGVHTISVSASYATGNVVLLSEPAIICVPLLEVSIAPISQNISYGSTINLMADVVGDGVVEFLWITPGRGAITTTINSLAIPNSTSSDAGSYTVVAIDINGCASAPSDPATVTINGGIGVTLVSRCTQRFPSDLIALIATATGGTPPYQLIWSDGVIENGVTGPITRTLNASQSLTIEVIDAIGSRATARGHSALSQAILVKYCS